VHYQRRRFDRGTMPAWQANLLAAAVTGMSWDPHGDAWRRNLHEAIEFFTEHHAAPRYRSTDEREKKIAAWLAKQRHLDRTGQLSPERVAMLRQAPFRIL
jgi:hypothetical protein